MIKFICSKADDSFLESIAGTLATGTKIDLAVAYWGHGATEKLGLLGAKPTRVVCDLLSGGCNPFEIKRLRLALNDANQVRCFGGLHAKVYLTDKYAVVGSANASANGLGGEGQIGTVEAAIQTDDVSAVTDAAAWFEQIWNNSLEITEKRLRDAEEAWNRQKPQAQAGDTVLQKYLTDPQWFRRRVTVTYYVTEASETAIEKFDEVKHEYYSPNELKSFTKGNYPLYDCDIEDVPAEMLGTFVIGAADNDIYSILKTENYSKKECAVLLKPEATVMGLVFPKQQRNWLRKAIEHHLSGTERDVAWNLEDLPNDVLNFLQEKMKL